MRAQHTRSIEPAAPGDDGAKEERQRPQKPGEQRLLRRVPRADEAIGKRAGAILRHGRHLALDDCVANVMCKRPAIRAASMTRTTDWCVACASALMMTTGSLASPAALRSMSASALAFVNVN